MTIWQSEDDARGAADRLIELAGSLEVPSWSSRELELRRLAADAAAEKLALGPFHPYVLGFSEQLRQRSDLRGYKELWLAVVDAEKAIAATRRYRWQSVGFAS